LFGEGEKKRERGKGTGKGEERRRGKEGLRLSSSLYFFRLSC